MHVFENNYLDYKATGDLKSDINTYFTKFKRADTYEHTLDVVSELNYIHACCGGVEPGSLTACYCHDLGRVVPNDMILEFCAANGITVTEDEKQLPSILHQKLSAFIAERVFGIDDQIILNAIRYHSTSRKCPSMTEIEVLLADKMSWKEDGYREVGLEIKKLLNESKEAAIFYYLKDMYDNKDNMKLYHSDSKEAYEWFDKLINK